MWRPGRLSIKVVLLSWFGLMALGVMAALVSLGAGLCNAQAQTIPSAALQHERPLRREAQRVWGLNAPVATFAAQAHQESQWRPDARSPVGALGLTQFMPATAKWIGTLDQELATPAPLNPTWALRALVVYDHWLYERIQGAADHCQRMAFSLAAYNGGLGWVQKRQAIALHSGQGPGQCLGGACRVNPGVNPAAQRENEAYPIAIFKREPIYRRWGLGSCS